jgi:hypothetical protein
MRFSVFTAIQYSGVKSSQMVFVRALFLVSGALVWILAQSSNQELGSEKAIWEAVQQ